MSERGGWIKIHRKMLEWGWYSDPVTSRVFIHLLLLANFGEREFLGHKIMPGQAVITYGSVAKSLGLTVQNVRTALEHLESTHEINRQVTSKFQVITIEKWTLYQLDEGEGNRQVTSNQQASNKQVTINQQHYKKERKEECNNYYSLREKEKERENDILPTLKEEQQKRLAEMRAQLRKANEE